MNKEDKKLQKHLVDEMMKVSETNPDVMIYMQSLMKCYEDLEKEIDRLNNIISELEKYLEKIIVDSKAGSSIYYNYLNIYNYLKELKENNK